MPKAALGDCTGGVNAALVDDGVVFVEIDFIFTASSLPKQAVRWLACHDWANR